MNGGKDVLFSLIVPTLGRREEVGRLLASFEAQVCRDFEIIVVDQNRDGLLDAVCSEFAGRLPLQHLKVEKPGAARARNHGLQSARGSIINFPDDDCEFTPDLLLQVAERFREGADLDALFVRAIDPISREDSVIKSASGSQWVTDGNFYRTTCEATMFARRGIFDAVGLMDETLGVGTFFGAEEGADFVLRALYMKKRLYYDPLLIMHHPRKVARYDAKERARAYSYGRGFGRLSAKHLLLFRRPDAMFRFLNFQARSSFAFLLYLFTLKPERSRYYFNVIMGRLAGAFHSWREFWNADGIERPEAFR
jgi:glycosyltransferase involved in cell wall biosynthesis